MWVISPDSRTCNWCNEIIGKGRFCSDCAALAAEIRHSRLNLAWKQLRQASWREPGGINMIWRRAQLLAGIICQHLGR